jgi:hypothetical protein
MYAIPITIEHGVLKLPPNSKLPPDARSAILVFGDDIHSNDDLDTLEFKLAALRDNPSLAFLEQEPDLYSINDVKPENRNPYFGVQ